MNEEALMELQNAYQNAQGLEQQIGIIDEQINELRVFESNLKGFDNNKNNSLLAPLGKGVFVDSEIKSKELIVNVGAGFFIKKNVSEALKVIEHQVHRLGEIRVQMLAQLNAINVDLQNALEEAEHKH